MPHRDIAECREAIRHGSRSFHAASHLLPKDVREAALALYAFCRLADDAVDLRDDKAAAVLRLRDRLDHIYDGTPIDAAADRAFSRVVHQYEMPKALPDALIEGLAWDATEREYETLSDLRAYSARVASAVGAMMCVIMKVRNGDALARACDMGVAMQLTNIARDVGEDARMGRVYLPLDWLAEEGIDKAAFLADPVATPAIRRLVARLLREAERLYLRSEAGIAALPVRCRPAIYACRHIYAAIGAEVARAGYDSISTRAHTSTGRKLALLAQSGVNAGATVLLGRQATLYANPLPEVAFLVEAAARRADRQTVADRVDRMMDLFAELERRDRGYPDPREQTPAE
ncbi:phytoene synthase [Rubricella aquisinus]|uniref:Phytoene synthase n=1 Tax=Rubricella aquisinus TaxID=2028108 RepID=A0A840WPB3_9RHOB|nr:phytoene/squalene synthase family protein [Rubricella aquisinus]MBB5516898.1 phytoene synthase [Rubricella aquisinus]